MMLGGQAQAETLVVSKTTDTPPGNAVGSCFSGFDCSLREAVTDANDNGETPGRRHDPASPRHVHRSERRAAGDPRRRHDRGHGRRGGHDDHRCRHDGSGNLSAGAIDRGRRRGEADDPRGDDQREPADRDRTGRCWRGRGRWWGDARDRALRPARQPLVRPPRASEGAGAIAADGASVTITRFGGRGQRVRRHDLARGRGRRSRWRTRPGRRLVVSRSSISRNRVDPVTGTNSSAVGGLEVNLGASMTMTDSTVSRNTRLPSRRERLPHGRHRHQLRATVTTDERDGDRQRRRDRQRLHRPQHLVLRGGDDRIVRNSIVAGCAPHCFISGPAITSVRREPRGREHLRLQRPRRPGEHRSAPRRRCATTAGSA